MLLTRSVRLRVLLFSLVIVLLFASFGSAAAQGGVLAYGQAVIGRIDATAPLAFFSFSGNAGDLVTARAIAISDGLDPSLSILSATQQQLGSNDNDPLLPGSSDARVSVRLPAAGTYTILIGSAAGTAGELLLTLDGRPGQPAQPLPVGGSAVADFVVVPAPVNFDLQVGGSAAVLNLRAQTTSPFTAEVRSPEGRVIASISEGIDVDIVLPPATGRIPCSCSRRLSMPRRMWLSA